MRLPRAAQIVLDCKESYWVQVKIIKSNLYLSFRQKQRIRSQNNSGGKGPQEVSRPISWLKQGQLWGCSGLYQVRFWKIPGTERVQPPPATHSTAWLSSRGKSFPLHSVWNSPLSAYAHCCSSSRWAPLYRAWLWLLLTSPQALGGAVRSPCTHLFPSLNKPWFLSFAQNKCSSPKHPGEPLLTCPSL